MNSNFKKGIIFALITGVISGFSIFYNKLVIVKGIEPTIFNIIKNGGVAIFLSFLILTSQKYKKLFSLSPKHWLQLISIGIVGGGIPFILYFEGLKQVPAINANLIHKTMFLWVALAAIPFLKEKLNTWQVIGYILVAASNLFIGGFQPFTGGRGELMILAATLFWSSESIIAKITLKNLDSEILAWARMAIGLLVILLVAAWQGKIALLTKITSDQIAPISGSILLLSGYVYFWYKGLKLAPVTVVTSILMIATPITNVLSAVFITHTLPQPQIIQLISAIAGITLITFIAQKTAIPTGKIAKST